MKINDKILTADLVKQELLQYADSVRAKNLSWFFKTGKGEYGEGDIFIGITVPVQRKVAHSFKDLSFKEIGRLLKDPIHECRFTALEILVAQFEDNTKDLKQKITTFYLANTKYINNWDLVDTSALYIIGAYLFEFKKSRAILYKLAHSKNLWERRIAIVSTFYFIARNDFKDSLEIAEILLSDEHDLIHKAVGWMLREIGKRDKRTLVSFLDKYAGSMPRTMLRYSIEKFSESERKKYLGMTKFAKSF